MSLELFCNCLIDSPDRNERGLPEIRQYGPMLDIQLDEATNHQSRRISLEVLERSDFSLSRDEHGYTTVHLLAARRLDEMKQLIESKPAIEALVQLRGETESQGWTSLHISTIANNEAMVKFILDKFSSEDDKMAFIKQVDQLGLTSLHWGAARNSVEALDATMNHMSLEQQQAMLTEGRWTLLHASALGNAQDSMMNLIERFPDRNIRWRIMSCPTRNGQTALHIAVAEGNDRAAIMLTDLAGEEVDILCSLQDSAHRTAIDDCARSPLLDAYLQIRAVTEGPALHEAAMLNDHILVSYILKERHTPVMDALNEINRDQMTVLQAACYTDSAEVIGEVSKLISEEDFIQCIKRQSVVDGETALHIAVLQQSNLSLHTLLKSIKSNHGRAEVLSAKNRSGKTVLDLNLTKSDHQSGMKLLQCEFSSILLF